MEEVRTRSKTEDQGTVQMRIALDMCKSCFHIRQEHAYNMYHCQRRVECSRGTDYRCDCNEFIYQEVPA